MNWIVTVKQGADLADLAERLSNVSARLRDQRGVPLNEGRELAFRIEGPDDLQERLTDDPEIIDAFPDSEMDYA